MDSMVERVAQVLYLRTPQTMDVFTRDCADPKSVLRVGVARIPWEDLDDEDRDPFIETARAAIEAMREPTRAMAQAGADDVGNLWAGEASSLHGGVSVYQAMIDAALERSA